MISHPILMTAFLKQFKASTSGEVVNARSTPGASVAIVRDGSGVENIIIIRPVKDEIEMVRQKEILTFNDVMNKVGS